MDNRRIVVSFSCGASSAVAAKIAVERYAKTNEVAVVRCALPLDEHPDNERFSSDVEKWIHHPIEIIKNNEYSSTEEVFRRVRWICGLRGAACSTRLKRQVIAKYKKHDDISIIGFTADEKDRIIRMEELCPDETFLWVLADAGITKDDCYNMLLASGIELPVMYKQGYNHNNCIGCVKGGMGYWNKIRRDYPQVFSKRAALEREIGYSILKNVWLDELDPDAGRDVIEPPISCGLICESYVDDLREQCAISHIQEKPA